MAISETVKKGYLNIKTAASTYTRLLPRTLASLVSFTKADGTETDLQTEVTQLNSNLNVIHTVHSNTSTFFSESYKYPDGRMDINIRKIEDVSIGSSSGGIFFGGASAVDFPIPFVDIPMVNAFVEQEGLNAFCWGEGRSSKTKSCSFFLGRGTARSGTVALIIKATGRWK